MTTINNISLPAIRTSLIPANERQALLTPITRTNSAFELNPVLLTDLIIQLEKTGDPQQLDGIRKVLSQHDVGNDAADFSASKLCEATAKLHVANSNETPSEDFAEMKASQARRVDSAKGALHDIQREMTTQNAKANYSHSQFNVSVMKAEQTQKPAYSGTKATIHTSYAQLWAAMATAIDNIKGDYVDFYAELMQKYTKLYEAYNKHVQGASTKAVTAGKDGNHVNFSSSAMDKGYKDFSAARVAIDLGSVKNWGKMSLDEQKSMVTTLEPAFKVSAAGDISFNVDTYSQAPGSPSGVGKDGQVSTASYQAWLASFNAGASALQSNMQAFAQRYSQANSTFDNLNKVLSGSISSLADSAREVIRNFS